MNPAERIAAIRARLEDARFDGVQMLYRSRRRDDAAVIQVFRPYSANDDVHPYDMELLRHAPADLAWLADLAERYGAALAEIVGTEKGPFDPFLGVFAVQNIAREALEAE